MTLAEHVEWFDNYAWQKIAVAGSDALPLERKHEHSMMTLENAKKILAAETGDAELERLGCLAALYHDLGRFDQYLTYGTFKDAESLNHGLLSVKLAHRLGRLNDEDQEARRLILGAIGLHNRIALPKKLEPKQEFLAKVIRDADKIDILRVISEHLSQPGEYNPTVILSLPDRSDIYSEKLVSALLARKTPSYADLKTVNDFRLLLAGWYFDMNFDSSREIFKASGHARKLLAGVPDLPHYAEIKKILLEAI